jgi:ArsR family transcriptional regulator, repressor of sdpIR and other operons
MRTEHVYKALADPTRRQIITLLKRDSLSAGELAEHFPMTKGSLSHHFNVLKAADLVRCERRGQQIVYSLNASVFEEAAASLMDLLSVGRPKRGRS